MAQHVAALEILAVAGLEEGQIFGEVAGVVAHVEARQEDSPSRPGGGAARGCGGGPEALQLGGGEGVGGARVEFDGS